MFIHKNNQNGISTLSSGHRFVLGSKASGHEKKLIFDETITKTPSRPCSSTKGSKHKTEGSGLSPTEG
jgi:hypothetical protein